MTETVPPPAAKAAVVTRPTLVGGETVPKPADSGVKAGKVEDPSKAEGKPDGKGTTVIDKETGKPKDATPFEDKDKDLSEDGAKDTLTVLSKAEKDGLMDSREVLEILATRGDVGKFLEAKAKSLITSDKAVDRAKGLDMREAGLLIQKDDVLNSPVEDSTPQRMEAAKLAKANKLTQIEAKLIETKQARQKLTDDNPKLADNQFAEMARMLVPGGGPEDAVGIKSMKDYFDKLIQSDGDVRVGALQYWEQQGVPSEVVKSLKGILFKEEIGEHKDKIKKRIKNTSVLIALISAMAVWAAAKKAGEGGQMGGH